ncbi:MAG: hypothetical protein NZ526_08300, partial [Aquificaceae bacterium]|nr:hypothetical protein [Aquificaceae bacterium]
SMQVVGKDGVNLNLLKSEYWREKIKSVGITEEKTNTLLPNLKNLKVLRYRCKVDPKNWKDALENLGGIYRGLRSENGKTYEYRSFVGDFLRGKKPQNIILRSLPFGLPIMYQSMSLSRGQVRAQAQLTWKENREDRKQDRRRASSILFNVKSDGFYALAFKCAFLPQGADIRLQAKGKYWDNNPSG